MVSQAEAELTIEAVMVSEASLIFQFSVDSQRIFGAVSQCFQYFGNSDSLVGRCSFSLVFLMLDDCFVQGFASRLLSVFQYTEYGITLFRGYPCTKIDKQKP